MLKKKILTFTREPGAANMFVPVIRNLKERFLLHNAAKDFAVKIYKNEDISFFQLKKQTSKKYIAGLFDKFSPDLIFTSATSLACNDMTERFLWDYGKQHHITTVALIDTWQNFPLRFSGPKKDESMKYIPDYIFVMNKMAADDLHKTGIARNKIITTGQPAFDKLANLSIPKRRIDKIKKRLFDDKKNNITFIFVSEPFKRNPSLKIGFDESLTLQVILFLLNRIASELNTAYNMIILLHPSNIKKDLRSVDFRKYKRVKCKFSSDSYTSYDYLFASDFVLGMISTFLVDCVILKKPVMSFQIGARRKNLNVLTRSNIVEKVSSEDSGYNLLKKWLTDSTYLSRYLKKQNLFKLKQNAVRNIRKEIQIIFQTKISKQL